MTLTIDTPPARFLAAQPPLPLFRSSVIPHAERGVASGELIRVRRGILAPSSLWLALPPWRRYEARVHAVAMTHPGVVFYRESAAAIRGLPVFGEPPEVHILDTPGATARSSGGIRVHVTAEDRVVDSRGGILITSLADTVIDLARGRHGAIGLAVADAALRLESDLTVEGLVAQNESRVNSRGRRLARWALHRATPLAETVLESVSRAAIEWLGFADPELQVEFRRDGVVDRVDMWWEDAHVIGEADGEIKYDGSFGPAAAAIAREKERDRRLRRHASGLGHWGWRDVAQIGPLRETLLQAGLRPVGAESSRELYGLSSVLRPPRASRIESAPARRD
ncbi:Transcriptional regulator, AbiEi antitoxin, Type IV TA system [Microbacterium sp. cf046]|uniref:hypothetical protein n=1 Tax=Microbacterium sp. cf046 TaxID=1761803 RepID=UPI0008E31E6E|nr:hypothetical protein [Microbacterium sp. cf046]SFS08341.1 Transcriptional regulator, AbiEi antitoxin, Type IV TA system [Microbacterium sp. cf046]